MHLAKRLFQQSLLQQVPTRFWQDCLGSQFGGLLCFPFLFLLPECRVDGWNSDSHLGTWGCLEDGTKGCNRGTEKGKTRSLCWQWDRCAISRWPSVTFFFVWEKNVFLLCLSHGLSWLFMCSQNEPQHVSDISFVSVCLYFCCFIFILFCCLFIISFRYMSSHILNINPCLSNT